MKLLRTMLVSLLIACLVFTGCAKKDDTSNMTPAEISEKAMDSFLTKVKAGNYTIDAKDFEKVSVYSNDLVVFDYVEDHYDDFAVMSVNNEVFQGVLSGDGLENVRFFGEGQATDAASSKLLNYLTDETVTDGNIYNLFYNQTEEPLSFLSNSEAVKTLLLSFANYNERALNFMDDVYLVLDSVDPKEAHLKAAMGEDVVARIDYEDIDVVVTFGGAKGNAAAEAWMKDPAYPEARTDWNEDDEFILNSVFLPPYGMGAVPFPKGSSYALKIDGDRFLMEDTAFIRDCRASEQDVQNYIDQLLKEGFTEAKGTDEDGNEITVYRRVLRDAYKCYTEMQVRYDNGLDIAAKKFYDFPEYDGIDSLNTRIKELGYPALPASDNFTSVKGIDGADELTESWLYFFNYDALIDVDMPFKDRAAAESYMTDYVKTLLDAGYTKVVEGGAGEEEEGESEEEDDYADYYQSPNGFGSFRYRVEGDMVKALYKSEKYISAGEAEGMIKEAGFPEVKLSDPISARDLRDFYKTRNNLDRKLSLAVSQTFATAQEAEDFLTKYEEALINEGYGRTNPDNVGSLKQIAIYNEEKGMLVAFDYFEEAGGAMVNFDFVAE